ncbi:MAG: hypothetical protein ACI9EF_001482 [Pseudohongiellaceae bacterium]|jgi:hypothetical protein
MRTLMTSLLVAGLSVQTLAQNTQNVVFVNDGGTDVSSGTANTRRVAWVDYDNDGDLDYFELNYDSANAIHENHGGGVFVKDTTPGNPLMGSSRAKGMSFGDFDGDGDQDLVIANGNGDANTVLMNLSAAPDNQPGMFSTFASGIETELGKSYDAAMGDLDGDGDADLVVANRYEKNEVYFGNGDGTFARDPSTRISTFANGTRMVEIVDLEGDGDLDVVVANSTSDNNYYYVNQGGFQGGTEGVFTAKNLDSLGTPSTTYGLAMGDLDNDGDLDVVAANRNQDNTIYRNALIELGVLAFQPVVGTALDGDAADTYEVAIGDLEGDGDNDLVFANRIQNNAIYLATQMDALASPDGFLKVTQGGGVADRGNSRSVALADVANYADPVSGAPIMNTLELAVGNSVGGTNWVYQNFGAQWSDLGSANGGVLGDPLLTGTGHTALAETLDIDLSNAPAASATAIVLSLNATAIPFKGGTLVADPTPGFGFVLLSGTTDGSGDLNYPLSMPAAFPSGVDVGLAAYLQVIITDASLASGMSLTNCLRLRISE